jgi:hypothetical protein
MDTVDDSTGYAIMGAVGFIFINLYCITNYIFIFQFFI